MKAILLIFLLLISSNITAQKSGWYFVTPRPTNMTLNNVRFLNQNTAIAIGYYGTVFTTTDGGANWSNPMSTSAVTGLDKLHYFDMTFFDQNTGYIIGDNAGGITKLFKTTNSGFRWTLVYQFTGLARAMHFIDHNTGWVGNGIQMLRTINGGISWQSSSTTFPSGIISVIFLDQLTGFATASNKILKSTDAGLNWLLVNSPTGGDINDLFFLNSQTGFAAGAGSNSVIQKTTNAGSTWTTKLFSNLTGTLSSVYFINGLTGIAAGGGFDNPPAAIFRTTDEGETWSQLPVTTSFHLNSISFSGNKGVVVGYGGKIGLSTDQGVSWTFPNSYLPQNLGFRPLSFINENTGWLSTTGYTGQVPIYRSTNGGINWENICMTSPYPDWIQFLKSNIGYYKSGNTLYKSTNGGYNWMQITPLNITVNSINFSDENTGYACGYATPPIRPKLIKTTNGGSSWDSIFVTSENSAVTSFNFINPNSGWVSLSYPVYPMGTNSRIFKTTNGGLNWNFQRLDTNAFHTKISFLDNLTGWAAKNDFNTNAGNLIRTTDGGNSWIILPLSVLRGRFHFVNSNTGWAENLPGSLFKSTNGGLNWYAQVDIGLAGIENLQFINAYTGWVVGDGGLIVKTTNGGELLGVHNISGEIPLNFSLSQNYPNPFNPVTNIKFDIPKSGFVKITVFDLLGREITRLVNEQMQPGSYNVDWDASNYPSGVYFYKLESEDFVESKKMVLVK